MGLSRLTYDFRYGYHKLIFNAEDIDELKTILSMIETNSNIKKKYYMTLFPRTIGKLCQNDWCINSSFGLDLLLKYCAYVFRKHKEELDEFMSLKSEFEKKLCLGEYNNCLNILNKIEELFGYSLWGIVKKLAIINKLYGFEELKRYTSMINDEKINNNIIIKTIIDFQSLFAEENTNYAIYKKKVDGLKNVLSESKLVCQYFDFKLCPERSISKDEVYISLMMDAQLSLIDMYETFITSFQICYLYHYCKDEIDVMVNDPRLINIYRLRNNCLEYKSNHLFYEVLELYTCGIYEKCIEKCEIYLKQEPDDFQCILLLAKSYLLSNKQPRFDDGLYKWLHDIYSLGGNEESSTQKLLASLKLYMGTSLEYKVLGFVARKTFMNNQGAIIKLSILNDKNLSPNITNFHELLMPSIETFDMFYNLCPITTKLFKYKYGYVDFPIEIIDKNRKYFFETDRYIDSNDYVRALNSVSRITREDNYISERVLRRKVRAYQIASDYWEMVKCITCSIIKNRSLKTRLNLDDMYKDISTHLTRELRKSIYYAVFVYICFPDDLRKNRIAYSNYIEGNKLRSIDEICEFEGPTEVLIEFLYRVCTRQILKRDRVLNPTLKNANNLRIDILKRLSDLDEKHVKLYNLEISSIMKEISINERVRTINNSKIYVDTDGIKKEIELDLQNEFERFLAIQKLDEEVLSYDYESIDYVAKINMMAERMASKLVNGSAYSQKLIVLKEILSRITEEFLFNEKYGLNTFLSSRIRHGYLKNQLTSVFESSNLLSKKKTNSSHEYDINEYWDEVLPTDTEGGNSIRKSLSIFTSNIQAIVDMVKNKWLYIKYKDETSEAFLDYTPVVNNLLLVEEYNINNFNDFYNRIISYLWDYTDLLFGQLRKKIETELTEQIGDQLNKLSLDISMIKDDGIQDQLNDLSNRITLCKAKYRGRMLELAQILERNDVSYWSYSNSDLLDTCMEIECKLNSHFSEININKRISDNCVYKGKYFPYFVDIMTILLNNAYEHSGIENYDDMRIDVDFHKINKEEAIDLIRDSGRSADIKVINSDFLSISVINKLGLSVDTEELNQKLNDIFERIKNEEVLKEYSQKEGGSGLAKLCNALKYNIDEFYIVLYGINEDNMLEISVVLSTDNIVDMG